MDSFVYRLRHPARLVIRPALLGVALSFLSHSEGHEKVTAELV